MVRRRWVWILLAALLCVTTGWRISLAKAQAAAAAGLKWQPTLDEAKRVAAQTNRLILVHFWAPSCKECAQLDKNVYSQPHVQQAIDARFVPLKLNADDFPTTTKQYDVDRLPTDLVITPAGQIVGRMKCPSTPDAYLQQLNIAASSAGPAANVSGAPATSAIATVGMPDTTALAPAVNAAPVQPPLYPTTTAVNPTAATNPPVMSNPAWAVQPPNATAANQPAQVVSPSMQPAGHAMQAANHPAVPAYSDDRYAEYFRRFSPSNPTATPATAATNPAGQSPAMNPVGVSVPAAAPPIGAAPQQQINAAPPQGNLALSQYSQPATSMPQYNPPPAHPVQYTSSAVGQGVAGGALAPQVSLPAPVSWPATPSPALNAATATQPYSGPSIAAMPTGTITGLTGASAAAPPVASAAAPPLGLDGYCPVTLAEQKRWQVGDRRFGVIHRGRTYLFAGPVEQQKFLSSPDRFSPAISGHDVVAALDQGQAVEGRRQFGVEYQGRTYLFAGDASRRAFSQNPKRYAAEVLQAENPNHPPLR